MIYIVLGVSGSGKSTIGMSLASKLELPFFDADDYHSEANKNKMASGTPLTDADREPWLRELAKLLAEQEQAGGAVLACSSLKQHYREMLESGLLQPATFIYLKGSFELIYARLKARTGHFMKPELLKSQFDALEEPDDALVIDIALPVPEIVKKIVKK